MKRGNLWQKKKKKILPTSRILHRWGSDCGGSQFGCPAGAFGQSPTHHPVPTHPCITLCFRALYGGWGWGFGRTWPGCTGGFRKLPRSPQRRRAHRPGCFLGKAGCSMQPTSSHVGAKARSCSPNFISLEELPYTPLRGDSLQMFEILHKL